MLRDELARLAADLPYAQGAAVVRVGSVLASKQAPADYWQHRGRDRFRVELADDGVDDATAAAALAIVDDALTPEPSLDDILEALVRRQTS